MEDDFTRQLLEYVNNTTIALLDDVGRYRDFLGFLSRMNSDQKIANKMLIYGYDPEATDVRTAEEWYKAGARISNDATRIYLLEYDESSAVKYTVKEAFDIRNTDAPGKSEIMFQDSGEFAEVVMASKPCKIRFDDKASGKEKCIYDSEKKEIIVTNNFRDYDEIAQSLLREYAHVYLDDIYRKAFTDKQKSSNEYRYNRETHRAEALSSGYMICSRYNRKLPEIPYVRRGSNISLAAIRAGLDNMCVAFSKSATTIDKKYLSLRKSYEHIMS